MFAKIISSWYGMFLPLHMSLGTLQGAEVNVLLATVASLVASCRQVTRPEFLLWLDIIF